MVGCKIKVIKNKMYFKTNFKVAAILLLLVFGVACKITDANVVKSTINTSEGPKKITSELLKKGVFNAPSFEFTDAYSNQSIQSNIKGLFFKGLDYKGKSTKVFCWYGEPKNMDKSKKTPAVVLVHGGGGTAFPQWVKQWTDRGYIAISVALEGQIPGERIKDKDDKLQHPTFKFSGPQRQRFFQDVVTEKLEDQWFFHAVADVLIAKSLLKSFPQVDETKIGITGISWGGILTNVITGLDNDFAFSVPVYGCGFLQETPHYSKMLMRLSKEQQEFYLKNWEPSLYIPFQKQPTLFVNGTNDFHFTMNSFTKTFEASNSEKYSYVKYNMKHGHWPGWESETIYDFADYVIKNDKKPQTVNLKNLDSNNKLTYSFSGDVKSANLYYSTDVDDWGSKSYTWIETDANVTKNEITATLPKKAVAYFLNTTNNKGIVYSTAMTLIK
ncbi:MAG: dienelactone hydrolase [Polaribacter sp.]|jgi:dienelactone hydrolase|tara:strand:+ start:3155 stop:4480 length:1326 start_codon:yes stop_codon:yes gene_type:complete